MQNTAREKQFSNRCFGINYKTGFCRAGCIHLYVINHLLNIIINSARTYYSYYLYSYTLEIEQMIRLDPEYDGKACCTSGQLNYYSFRSLVCRSFACDAFLLWLQPGCKTWMTQEHPCWNSSQGIDWCYPHLCAREIEPLLLPMMNWWLWLWQTPS